MRIFTVKLVLINWNTVVDVANTGIWLLPYRPRVIIGMRKADRLTSQEAFSPRIPTSVTLWLVILYHLTLLSVISTPASSSCSLYDSAVGVVCFHGDEVTTAIVTSGTSWLVEFYSSWCGHCQHFAPTWKELAKDIADWSSVVQLGVIDCSNRQSLPTCSAYDIRGYPTMRFFFPNETDPKHVKRPFQGARKLSDLRRAIVDHLESTEDTSSLHLPHFAALASDYLVKIPANSWIPVAIVFEEKDSYVGREVMLDLLPIQPLRVYRATPDNRALVNHYSILEFPSLIIETRKDNYIVTPGHSLADPRQEFRDAVQKHFKSAPHVISSSAAPHSDGHSTDVVTSGTSIGRRITRVNTVDLLGAVSFLLRQEVPLHSIISGSAFTALLRMARLLDSVFQRTYPAAASGLTDLRTKLELRLSAGFITNRDWIRLLDTKLDESLFPRTPEWKNCKGSEPHFRGYPCSLWMLAHTLTILTLPARAEDGSPLAPTSNPKLTFGSREALNVVSNFILNFFSCEYCREHFRAMTSTLTEGGVVHDGDAILWLWEAHNVVNRRLRNDISSDPLYPKALFPPHEICPYCYVLITSTVVPPKPDWRNTGFRSQRESYLTKNTSQDNLLYAWNRTAVLLFLWNFYHWNHSSSTAQEILRAAWPRTFGSFDSLHLKYGHGRDGLGFSSFDVGLCVVYYVLCGALLLAVGGWFLRRRLRHRRSFLLP